MKQDNLYFPLEKVQAFKAYFLRLRNASRGKPEYADLDTTLKLCEQLVALMQHPAPGKTS
jgi:hypothetical protein